MIQAQKQLTMCDAGTETAENVSYRHAQLTTCDTGTETASNV